MITGRRILQLMRPEKNFTHRQEENGLKYRITSFNLVKSHRPRKAEIIIIS